MTRTERGTGVLVCGHGSRDPRAVRQFEDFMYKLTEVLPFEYVEWGFLEFALPIISQGLDKLRERGVGRILAMPGLLFAAGHAKNDMPAVLKQYQVQYPSLDIRYGKELGITPKMLRAAADRVSDVCPAHLRSETVLLVVGRGSSDPDANADIAKVMRFLWEGLGFGWGMVAYSGVTFPSVESALEQACRSGWLRIVVFPYFLFTGVLVERIYAQTDNVSVRYPNVTLSKAPYLQDHPLVIESFKERILEIRDGFPTMNCQLCKYREAMVGFEDEVGKPQHGHHYHVEGIGVDGTLDHHHHHHHHHHSTHNHRHTRKS